MTGPEGLTYVVVVRCFIGLVSLFVGFGLGFIRLALLCVQGLPFLAEDLSDLACNANQ